MIGFAVAGLAATAVGWTVLGWRVTQFARQFAAGAPEPAGSRRNQPWRRSAAMMREFLFHKRLARKPVVALAHWLTMVSFLVLVATLAQATGQLFDPHFDLPVIGKWAPWNWLTEFFAWAGLAGILVLMAVRLRASRRSLGRSSRFFGSHQWRARYIEATILAVVVLVLWLRGLEALAPGQDQAVRFATSAWIGRLYGEDLSDAAVRVWISALALAKLLVSYAWMVVVGLTPTMGVAWHRFLAFPNLWTSRNPDGSPALGALPGLVVDGQAVDLEDPELDESVFERLGAATVADLTWRDRLALATCTECGRCQEVCPAWATDKPLSPKLLVGTLRDHVFGASADRLTVGVARPVTPAGDAAGDDGLAQPAAIGSPAQLTQGAPLVGDAPWAVSAEALWACTTCGACVDACPVGVEQLDLVVELRRHQVMVAGEFPSELATAFRNLERRKNPWGMLAKKRLDWTKGLDFPVPVLGQDVESLDQVDYLYWVGCAGAFDDRGQATARALATLLHQAGVSFAVLGANECCTGDPARRTGNESLFASLASDNVQTLNQAGATRIVVTCAHCLNSLANEYGPFGGRYQVVHHTELLAQLVAEGKLRPQTTPDGIGGQVTYQDPCYLARHNNQIAAPRRILNAIPGLKLVELTPSGRATSCCGAGGGRMWLEEPGRRVNARRFDQAAVTGAGVLATACPFCNVMMADAAAAVAAPIPVRDVAQLLLDALPSASPKETIPTEVQVSEESQ
ncbi:MAG: (Fe-S)-binding protein [Bifidobacteriaceae bacterium]|jgi:Fe-S oxidoreductase|nr:(Fe-S)-binding protein [Bifidobacteriaceae bacterium]